jgi:cysteinyl-tRNA synthetase
MRFFNTYSRQLEEFEPRDPALRKIGIYTCGPTVYSRAHIGNFRAYIFEDLLQRHLELRGYKVHRVMNITDVDDKTIRGAREAKIPLRKFTEQFKEAFFEDIETLRIKRADEFPAATDRLYIDKMIEMIAILISRGLAYQAEDKSVYFRINKFPGYGRLAHFDLTQLQSTGRVKHDEYDKEHIGDFALWKAWDEEDGDVGWESPWGRGRPGWHIECSAMATALLGEQIDIHCGGVDNIFPHHEAEIAQSEGVTGKKFVRYWLHCAHLLVDGQKMSKSLGNFYTLPDVLEKGYTGREIRYALMRVHYRAPLNFTWEGMEEARQALARIDEWLIKLNEIARPVEFVETQLTLFVNQFFEALDDDLNISAALGKLFELILHSNRAMKDHALDAGSANRILSRWKEVDQVLQIGKPVNIHVTPVEVHASGVVGAATVGKGLVIISDKQLLPDVSKLASERAQARLAKDFRKSDELRNELNARGWEVRDTKDGQKLTRRTGA